MDSVNPKHLSESLDLGDDGIWHAGQVEQVSYTADGHNLILPHEDSFWYRHRNKMLVQECQRAGMEQLLEIGGGNGLVAAALQKAGHQICLLEPGIEGVYHAQSRGIRHLIRADFYNAGIKTGAVPNAGLFDVLEHIEDDAACLDEIYRVLKPGGKVLISVPALPSLYSDFDREVGHYRRYTARVLKRKLSTAGFQVDYSHYFFHILWIPAMIMRKLRGKKRKHVSADERRRSEHLTGKKELSSLMEWVLSPELPMIRKNIHIPFGTSCIALATKPASK